MVETMAEKPYTGAMTLLPDLTPAERQRRLGLLAEIAETINTQDGNAITKNLDMMVAVGMLGLANSAREAAQIAEPYRTNANSRGGRSAPKASTMLSQWRQNATEHDYHQAGFLKGVKPLKTPFDSLPYYPQESASIRIKAAMLLDYVPPMGIKELAYKVSQRLGLAESTVYRQLSEFDSKGEWRRAHGIPYRNEVRETPCRR